MTKALTTVGAFVMPDPSLEGGHRMAGSTSSWFDGDNKSLVDNWVQIMEERGLDPDTVEKRELAEAPDLAAAVRRQWAENHPERASAPPKRRSSTPEEG